ncbi:unnamed protein product [Prorocentrum cordatum]|uniref:GAIN-B domain-containing protein n=1 Tax=Prorocentrum cordatum TaxID=2364126 RepID=A0ABN9TDN6_9DINO|nr:unnamed protein product [Polarella glacialis]
MTRPSRIKWRSALADFNRASEVWSSEGCSVVEVNGTMLLCACSHISVFASALGSPSLPEDVLCPNVAILSPAGFEKLGQGQWVQQRGGIALWTLLTVHLVIVLMACWSQGSWKAKPSFFMYTDDYRSCSRKVMFKKVMSAGRKSGKSKVRSMCIVVLNVVLNLQLDYGYEELCQKGIFDIIRTLIFYKLMMLWVTATMGFSELDSRYLRYGNVANLTKARSDDGPITPTTAILVGAGHETNNSSLQSMNGEGASQGEKRLNKHTERTANGNVKEAWTDVAGDSGAGRSTVRRRLSRDGPPELRRAHGAASGTSAARGPPRSTGTKQRHEWVKASDSGLTDEFVAILKDKSRLLQRRRNQVAVEPDPFEIMTASTAAKEAIKFSREAVLLFRAIHPLFKLWLESMTTPWIFQVLALLDAVFGFLMFSAAFYGTTACPNIPECAGPDDSFGNITRDVLVSLGCTVVGLAPLVILSRRDRRMARFSTERRVRILFWVWLLKDVVCTAGGLAWFAFCVLYIMMFLANVSQKDADHWLISLVIRFVCTWFLLPLVATILWIAIMRLYFSFSGGRFIENNTSGILRALNRGGVTRALEPAPDEPPKSILPTARAFVDPMPLVYQEINDEDDMSPIAGGDAGGGVVPPLVRAPLAETLDMIEEASESEDHFRSWIGQHVRNPQAASLQAVASELPPHLAAKDTGLADQLVRPMEPGQRRASTSLAQIELERPRRRSSRPLTQIEKLSTLSPQMRWTATVDATHSWVDAAHSWAPRELTSEAPAEAVLPGMPPPGS